MTQPSAAAGMDLSRLPQRNSARVYRGRPAGHCTICRHAERARAELMLAGGAGFSAVARKLSMSPDALNRHWRRHVSPERRAALLMGPVQVQALAAKVAAESESVVDHHRAVRAGLYQLFAAALEAGDRQAGALLSGRLREVNDSIGRITGELSQSPLIQQNTVNIFSSDPAFATFRDDLIRVLAKFPEAYEAVLAEFDRIEHASTAADLPALEHHAEESTEPA
jgi:hypothetical protein